jgi:hypothetical protein
MYVITPILLIAGGVLAVSGILISKKPDAKVLIDTLMPYQAFIGVAMLGCGVLWILKWGGRLTQLFDSNLMFGLAVWAVIACSILLGFLFGMPQIAKWIPGESRAEQKAIELSKQVAPFQVSLGLVGVAAALVYLMYRFNIFHVN